MDNKKFVGFYIIGAANEEEARKGAGLILWLQKKPNFLARWFDKVLLGIYWVEKEDYERYKLFEKIDEIKVEMPKRRQYKKKTDGSV